MTTYAIGVVDDGLTFSDSLTVKKLHAAAEPTRHFVVVLRWLLSPQGAALAAWLKNLLYLIYNAYDIYNR